MGIRMGVCKADGKPFEDIDLPITQLYGYWVSREAAKSAVFLIKKGYKDSYYDDAWSLSHMNRQPYAEIIIQADDFEEFALLYDEDLKQLWKDDWSFYNQKGVQDLIKKIKNKEITQIKLDWG